MKLSLIAVGKLKTPHWLAAQKDYLDRIRRYAPLTVKELKDQTPEKEGTEILLAAGRDAVIALTPRGKLLDSPGWAEAFLKQYETYSNLAFVIGGPEGLSATVLEKSRFQLSLSPMTLPHELARIVFLEQLYRAFTILGHEKYHK